MSIELERAHELLSRETEEGASYAQLRNINRTARYFSWQGRQLRQARQDEGQLWILRVLHQGAWSVLQGARIEDLENQLSVACSMAAATAKCLRPAKLKAGESLFPKAIRTHDTNNISDLDLPAFGDLLLLQESLTGGVTGIHTDYSDARIHSYQWDTEDTTGAESIINAQAKFRLPSKQGSGVLECLHSQSNQKAFRPSELDWKVDTSLWLDTLAQDPFHDSSLSQMSWVFSPKALATLVVRTLGPTLCLDRPDAFNSTMNPASLDEKELGSPLLNLISDPNLYYGRPALDPEGVPSRRVILLQNGILKNFSLSRQSAQRLSRSLSIRKEKVLAGSSRTLLDSGFTRPALRFLEIGEGESDGALYEESHLYLPNIQVTALDRSRDRFCISAENALVSKYGGLHRRRVSNFSFYASRDEIWKNLQALGKAQREVFLSPLRAGFSEWEPWTLVLSPAARFGGLPCVWS